MVGDDVRVVVISVDRDQVKIGIEAPRNVAVHRSEIYEEIRRGVTPPARSPEVPRGQAPE